MKKIYYKSEYKEVCLFGEELPDWYHGQDYRILRDTYSLDHVLPEYGPNGEILAGEIPEAKELKRVISILRTKSDGTQQFTAIWRAAYKLYAEITSKYEDSCDRIGLTYEITLKKWNFSEERIPGSYRVEFDQEWLDKVQEVVDDLNHSGEFSFSYRRNRKAQARKELLANCKDKRDFFNKKDFLSFRF